MKKNFIWGLIGLLVVASGIIGALLAIGKLKKSEDEDYDYNYDLDDFDELDELDDVDAAPEEPKANDKAE